MKTTANFDKLKELTARLTSWEPKAVHPGYIEINVLEGISKAYKLMYEPCVAVCKVFMSKGTRFAVHAHEAENETIVMYKGELEVTTSDKLIKLTPGDSLHLLKGEAHSTYALTDLWAICVTVPACEDFPK